MPFISNGNRCVYVLQTTTKKTDASLCSSGEPPAIYWLLIGEFEKIDQKLID